MALPVTGVLYFEIAGAENFQSVISSSLTAHWRKLMPTCKLGHGLRFQIHTIGPIIQTQGTIGILTTIFLHDKRLGILPNHLHGFQSFPQTL